MGANESARAWVRHLHRNHDFLQDEPLFAHLERVATALAPRADSVTTITGWLHHVDETHIYPGTIEGKFGMRVKRAVGTLARLEREPDAPFAWRVAESDDTHAQIVLSACFSDLATHHPDFAGRARWKAAYDQMVLAVESRKGLS